MPRLIACVLGGTAPRARTELHDVAFAAGDSLEAAHEQLLSSWFGDPHGLHVDAWCFLDSVEGYRVHLAPEPSTNGLQLYFINIGGYRSGEFGERHAWGFFGAPDKTAAKAHAKRTLLQGFESIHNDDLHDIDDCLQIEVAGRWHIQLEADPSATAPVISNGYFPIPARTISAWLASQRWHQRERQCGCNVVASELPKPGGESSPAPSHMPELAPFHLAFPVASLADARAFYGDLLGCPEGRSSGTWVDFDFFGHQIVAHLAPEELRAAAAHDVDGDNVPVRHFGVVLAMAEWHLLAGRLRAAGTHFVIEPHVRFKDQPGEQATMFLLDPSGNALEFKAFADRSRLFAK